MRPLPAGPSPAPIPATDVLLIGSLNDSCDDSRPDWPQQPFGLAELGRQLAALLRRSSRSADRSGGPHLPTDLERPLIMGILNVTPDSFSDGGRFLERDQALQRAGEMAARGGRSASTSVARAPAPGRPPVPLEQELERVVPVIEAVCRETGLPLSVDTNKSVVARAAVCRRRRVRQRHQRPAVRCRHGRGLWPRAAPASSSCTPAGAPSGCRHDTRYADLAGEVIAALAASLEQARAAGVAEEKLAVDPGIGFGKSPAGNLELLRRLGELHYPGATDPARDLAQGVHRQGARTRPSRPSGCTAPWRRSPWGLQRGARIFRVHDVGAGAGDGHAWRGSGAR